MGSSERSLCRRAHGKKYRAVMKAWKAVCDRGPRFPGSGRGLVVVPPVTSVPKPVFDEPRPMSWWRRALRRARIA
jgi:hypothetical protein